MCTAWKPGVKHVAHCGNRAAEGGRVQQVGAPVVAAGVASKGSIHIPLLHESCDQHSALAALHIHSPNQGSLIVLIHSPNQG